MDLPVEKGPRVGMTVYEDADYAHGLVTKRSITRIHVKQNNMLFGWLSKCLKRVETSTFGSDIVASRIVA
jgi:hypothetical protein